MAFRAKLKDIINRVQNENKSEEAAPDNTLCIKLPEDIWNCIIGYFSIDRQPAHEAYNSYSRIMLHQLGLVSKHFHNMVKKQFRPTDIGKLREYAYSVMNVCADHGWLDLLIYFQKNKGFQLGFDVANHAARSGHLNILDYCFREKCPMRATVADNAAQGGHLDCLKYALTHGVVAKPQAAISACDNDSVECLDYLFQKNIWWRTQALTTHAAKSGAVKCLQLAVSNGAELCPSLLSSAAASGNLEMIRYVFENTGRYWGDHNVQASLLQYGNMGVVEYAANNGMVWSKSAYSNAGKGRKLDVLKYLLKNGVEMGEDAVHGVITGGSIECLRFLIENGCKPHPQSMMTAVKTLRLDMLKEMRAQGWQWYPELLSNLVHSGHSSLHLLTYACEDGYRWNPNTKCAYSNAVPCLVCQRAWDDFKTKFNVTE